MNQRTIRIVLLIISMTGGLLNAQINDSIDKGSPKIGLVLSGGGAKGFAHIGVLKVLEQYGIRPDYITGTSMGSIVGALYSLGYSATQLERIVTETDWEMLFSDKISFRDIPILDKNNYPGYPLKMAFVNGVKPSLPTGMIQGQQIQALFSKLVWESNIYPDFDAFPIPYRCVATDIISGKAVVIKEGNLAEAMRSSMAIPTVFSPVDKNSMLLVDGGIVRNFPVQDCIEMGADIVIGVYTGFNDNPKKKDLSSMIKLLARTSAFPGIIDSKEQAKKTDVLIEPDLSGYGPDSFRKVKEIIALGEKAAEDPKVVSKLKEIASLTKTKGSISPYPNNMRLWVDKIEVTGCTLTNKRTIKKISGLKPKRGISADEIDDAMRKIYSTWQFEKVTYSIKRTPDEQILVFQVYEKNRATLNLGLHYDNSYGPNVLMKASYNNLFLKSTKASAKLSISQNPRVLLRYQFYPTTRRRIELSFNTYLQLSKMPDIVKEENDVYTLGHYVYAFADFNISLNWRPIKNTMLQTKVGKQFSNIVLKEGMELYYNTNTVNYNYSFYQFRMYVNTLNDPYFPTEGLYLDIRYKYNFQIRSDQNDTSLLEEKQTNNNEIINFHYQQYFLIANRVSVIPELSFGAMSEKAFITEKFFLGGLNYSLRPNTYNFAGIRSNYIAIDNFFMIGITTQLMLRKKWFFQLGFQSLLIANYADYELEDNETELDDNYFGSWKAGVGYQSKFGPLRFVLSKSPERKEFVWSMNIGVPF